MTDYWVVSFPAPALMGFLFTAPALFLIGPEALIALLFYYLLPWAVCSFVIFFTWHLFRKRKGGPNQSAHATG